MSKKGVFTFLGSGASTGVPVIGCSCSVCLSSSPYDKRLRPSGLIEIEDKRFVIDVGPDFRQQALKYGIDRLDGMLLTHTHYDHIGGVDELRILYFKGQKRPLPCLLSKESFEDLKVRYHYLASQFDFHFLPGDFGSVEFCDLVWNYVSYSQMGMKVAGYRLGNFAYISDIREYTQEVVLSLRGIEVLVVSALRPTSSFMHFSLDEGLAFARSVGAKKTYFTHVAHDLDHEATNRALPEDVRLGYDGLKIEFTL